MSIERLHVGRRLSEVAIFNKVVYLAGQVADSLDADITKQTQEVLAHVDRLLAEAKSDKSRILSATCYLADLADYNQFNQVWDEWVAPNNAPPRATVEAALAKPEYLVEVKIVAAQFD